VCGNAEGVVQGGGGQIGGRAYPKPITAPCTFSARSPSCPSPPAPRHLVAWTFTGGVPACVDFRIRREGPPRILRRSQKNYDDVILVIAAIKAVIAVLSLPFDPNDPDRRQLL
jgi:hypothetical protein